MLNTRYYKGYINSPAKLIKIDGGQMETIKEIFNNAKTYEFDGFCVRMSSPLIVECKEILDGAAFKSGVKYEILNVSVPPKDIVQE